MKGICSNTCTGSARSSLRRAGFIPPFFCGFARKRRDESRPTFQVRNSRVRQFCSTAVSAAAVGITAGTAVLRGSLRYSEARIERFFTPSPGNPGEGWGDGDFENQRRPTFEITLTPALSRITGRGGMSPSILKTSSPPAAEDPETGSQLTRHSSHRILRFRKQAAG